MTPLASYTAKAAAPLAAPLATPMAHNATGIPQALPRFGAVNWARTFAKLEAEPLREVLVKDIAGFNVPRLGVAGFLRGAGDFFDTLWSEAANTLATVAGTFTLVPAYRRLGNWVSGTTNQNLRLLPEQFADLGVVDRTKRYLAHLAGDIGFLLPFGALPLANPFIRNAITLWKTGTSDFETIVGLRKEGSQPAKPKTPDPKDTLAYHLNKVGWINGLGFALGAALTVGLGLLSRKMKPDALKNWSGTIEKVFKTFGLTGKKHNQITGELPVFLFWLLPAYVGWYIAARSKNEKIESIVKGVNSTLWFLAFNRFLVKPAMGRKFRQEIAKLGQEIQPLLKDNIQDYTSRIAKAWKGPLASSWEKDFLLSWEKISLETLAQRKIALAAIPNPGKNVQQALTATEKLIQYWTQNPEKHKLFSQLKTKADWLNYGIAIAMLATTPAILNVWLTGRRFAKEQEGVAGPPDALWLPAPALQTNTAYLTAQQHFHRFLQHPTSRA